MSDATPSCKPPGEPAATRAGDGSLALLDPATPAGTALRTAAACVVAMAVALALHVEVPALAVVFVLARGSAGAGTMLVGGAAGAATALVLLDVLDQSPVGMTLALLVLGSGATYFALGRRRPYAFVQGLLLLLIVVGQGLDTPDDAVRHAFYDLASVAIAAFAAFVAGASQPVALPAQLQATLAAELSACGRLLAAAESGAGPLALRMELLARRAHALVPLVWPTRLVSRRRRRALGAASALVDDAVRASLALHALDATPRHEAQAGALAVLRESLAAGVSRVAGLLAAARGPADVARAARRARARSAALAARRAALPAPADAPGVALAARALGRRVARLAALSPLLAPGAPGASVRGRVRPARGVRRPRLDRFRARHAVKSGACYVLVLWAWVAAGWGAIVPALVVSVLVATLATPLGATLRKAALRVGGVLAGGAAGLAIAVLLLPWITSLPAICAVTGAGLLAFLLVQQRHERLAFASLQAAIAFALTLVQGPGPDPSSRAPVDSLIGLAFGIAVVVLVMHAVWPLDAASSVRRALAVVVARAGERLAGSLAGAAFDGRRDRADEARAARAHAAGFAHEVALYGPQLGRPAEDVAVLFLHAARLDALATLLEEATPTPAPDRAAAALAAEVARAAGLVAAALAALPGEPLPEALEPVLGALETRARALAARRAGPDAHAALHAEVACGAAHLLRALADAVRPVAGSRDAALRAA